MKRNNKLFANINLKYFNMFITQLLSKHNRNK